MSPIFGLAGVVAATVLVVLLGTELDVAAADAVTVTVTGAALGDAEEEHAARGITKTTATNVGENRMGDSMPYEPI